MSTLSGGPNIVTNGLVMALDAANPKSYPGSGTVWRDISRTGANGTLINGPTFDSGNGGVLFLMGLMTLVGYQYQPLLRVHLKMVRFL
jgi:hypothetical protein